MNKCVLIGRLTRDPELRYTQSGLAVANFTLAVDRPYTSQGGKREADFVNCVVWKGQAEALAQYMGKGGQVAVEGRLQIRSYTDKNGIEKRVAEIVCNQVKFLGSKKDKVEKEPVADTAEEDVFPEQNLPF